MNETTVFSKTDRGWAEIRNRNLKLPMPMRVLLIATDGNKSVGDMTTHVLRDSDVRRLYTELLALELVAAPERDAVMPGVDETAPTLMRGPQYDLDAPAPINELDFNRFEQAREHIETHADRRLGRDTMRFMARLNLCSQPEHLRALLPEYRGIVSRRLGVEPAEAAVRELLDILGE